MLTTLVLVLKSAFSTFFEVLDGACKYFTIIMFVLVLEHMIFKCLKHFFKHKAHSQLQTC